MMLVHVEVGKNIRSVVENKVNECLFYDLL